jgi:hypothetical protein
VLVIRAEHIAALAEASHRRFVERMAHRLRSINPSSTLTEPGFLALVERGIQRASTFGITAETHVERFLDYFLRYGEDFGVSEATEWAGSILRTPNAGAAWKLNRVDEAELFASE